MTLKVTSSAFESGQGIPVRFTCEGADSSPPLQWTGVPADAKSLALICDDPDAPVGTWVHWVLYDLPASTVELNEKVPTSENEREGAHIGNVAERSQTGGKRFQTGRLRRAMPATGKTASLLLQAIRTRHQLGVEASGDQGGITARHEGSPPR